MPEGHKTHFLAQQHSRSLSGQSLQVTSPQGRFRGEARKVNGKTLDRCEAVGKHLFYHFEGERIVHVHLGRYGKFRLHPAPPPKPVGQVRMRLVGEHQALDLTGPTTCRVIDPAQRESVLERLGPDPLAGGNKRQVWRSVQASKKPIGALVLDQSVIAGVGNIFRAELFFELGMDPRLPGNQLNRDQFDRLWRSLRKMMRTGLKYGQIITVSSKEAGVPLATLEGKKRFRIYGKERCPSCRAEIETLKLAARKLYWCPACQAA